MGQFPLMPTQASAFAPHYDLLFFTILGLSILFTVGTVIFVIYFSIVYRRENKVDRTNQIHDNMPLELTWTIIPSILGLAIFAWSTKLFIDYRTPPKDATEIYVVGKQWMWHIQHATSGVRENNTIHVPLGRNVKFTMISQDVIHAFYIPEFRLQFQVVPGRYTEVWTRPTKEGTYRLFCAMYCGNQHSEMGGYVYVMKPEEYDKWVANGGNDAQPQTLVQRGAELYERNACSNCHGSSDTMRAPSLYGLYGKTRHLESGETKVANEPYIREAILRPYDHLVAGYGKEMPEYQGTIQEDDIPALIAYIKTLGQSDQAGSLAPSSTVQKGSTPTSKIVSPRRKLAVGALDAQTPKTPGLDRGHLAAGALGTSQTPKERN